MSRKQTHSHAHTSTQPQYIKVIYKYTNKEGYSDDDDDDNDDDDDDDDWTNKFGSVEAAILYSFSFSSFNSLLGDIRGEVCTFVSLFFIFLVM